jgi:hypothetical protein
MSDHETDGPPDAPTPPQQESPGSPEGPAPESARQTLPPTQESAREDLASVTQNFYGTVNAEAGTFGLGTAGSTRRKAATGKLSSADIATHLDHYVPPGPFKGAVEALTEDHVVALVGSSGIGKRTGAIALLHEVTSGPLAVLSPSSTLAELAERPYKAGFGYVVGDRFDEGLNTEVTDFTWRTVRDQLLAANAYLVVTTTTTPRGLLPESVQHITWERPSLPDLLREYLAHVAEDQTIGEAIAKVPPECPMSDIVQIAARVAQGDNVETATRQVLDQTGRRFVQAWFEQDRTRREILEVTVLAFLLGASERAFEALLDQLERSLAASMPVATAETATAEHSSPATEVLPQRRGERTHGNGLISLQRTVGGGLSRRVLTFTEDSYRGHVLAQLWDRYDNAFWDAVEVWLDELVASNEPQHSVAVGLALLSYVAFDEVDRSLLHHWSDGYLGWQGQSTAALTLWWMCLDEELAPVALRTATRWISYGSTAQRWTAAVTFTGELGVRYPTDAVRRLWQLVAQDNNLSEPAAAALARLFATLTDRGEDASVVARHLETQLESTKPHGRTRRRRGLLLLSALFLLSVPAGGDSDQPTVAVMAFLHDHPDQVPLVARLWSAVLRHRPYRHAALLALWDGLRALGRLSPDPEPEVRSIGVALAATLTDEEHERLRADVVNVAEHARRRRPNSDSLMQILLAALEKVRLPDPEGQHDTGIPDQ